MVKSKQPSQRDLHRAALKAAMPVVEAAVREHGLSIVGGCIAKLREKGKLKRKAADLRKQIEEIEGQL